MWSPFLYFESFDKSYLKHYKNCCRCVKRFFCPILLTNIQISDICFQALSSGTYVNISQSPDHCQTSQSAQVIPTSGALLSLTQSGTFYLIVNDFSLSCLIEN